MSSMIQSGLKRLLQIESTVAAAAYGILAVTILVDVFAREVLSIPILGTQRFAVYMSIIAGFLGVGLATAMGAHMRPRVADTWVPRSWDKGLKRLSNLVAAVIFGTAGYYASLFWHTGYTMGDTAPVLNWPLWPIQLVVPYAFFTTTLRYLLFAVFSDLDPTNIQSTNKS